MVGVEPDIRVQQTARPINGSVASGDDAVLAHALEFARKSFGAISAQRQGSAKA